MKDRRNKNFFRYLAAGTLLVLTLLFAFRPVTAKADFGDFGGDTDYGGDWDSGGSWDSGNDYSSNDYYGGGSSSGGGGSLIPSVIIAVIIIIIVMNKDKHKGKKGRQAGPRPQGAAVTPASALKPMSGYTALDPAFNEAAFRERMSNLYIQMQQDWHNKNIEPLKPYFTDAYWNQMDRQLDQKRQSGQTPCTERVTVLETTPRGFYQTGGMDHIVVKVRARLVAYVIDDRTGNVISGDRNREKFMEYEWDVCRKSGVTTQTAGMQSISCPHCGAPLDINQTAKCPYCGSIVTVVNEDWALNNIKGVSQQTI